MLNNVFPFEKSCAFCNSKKIYKYGICEECYDNLNMDISFHKNLNYVDEIIIGCEYNDFLKDKIRRFKFKDETHLYKFFGEMLIDLIFKNDIHRNYKVVTSVPMHKKSLKKRGYNQSELMAKYISENTLIPYCDLLEKVLETKDQVGLDFLERGENLKGAFRCAGNLRDKRIIIVDDIITTGSTVDELGKLLKEKGAKKVAALIVATRQFL
ncbi:ComF family protein [Anaerosphaera multitolerans]|uniref:ComF family protein n=1 Tax=Anaerosphaera multitolerans TaxID=2487351 RepID=A0A437S9C9_9FIRM|nr:phosphoribosyltransferase family protein [Anaerosphaera multitolerans]RVU55602.1 ComF family protein [Anaerosphaera multitolerans]